MKAQPIKLNVEQGTNDWHDERQRRIGASESPIILLKQLEWGTPLSLYENKILPIGESKRDAQDNWATKRGKYFEPKVRARYELFSDLDFPEGSYYRSDTPHIMASLDGVNFEAKKIIEIKVPSREVYELAQKGQVHPKYVYQLEQQLYVMCDEGDWSVDFICGQITKVDGRDELTDHVVVNYKSDPAKRKELLDAVNNFWFNHVVPKIPPPLCDEDAVTMEISDLGTAYSDLVHCLSMIDSHNEKANEYKKKAKELQKQLEGKVTHPYVKVGQLEIVKRTRKGNVNWKLVEKDTGISVDKYRDEDSQWLEVKLVS